MTGDNKTVINNWTGGGTLQTWTDDEWQILYAKDSAGNVVTLSLTSHDAVRLAYAVSPIPQEQFDRMRAANAAVYELSYPEARADELRQIADEIECDGGCEGCGPQKQERGEFCGFVAADNLRKLASALDVKATIDAALHSPKIAAAETGPGDVIAVLRKCRDYIASDLRMSRDEDEKARRHNLIEEATAAANRLDVKAEAKSQEPEARRVSVPEGQTPLDDKLGHKYLDVFREGGAARDTGARSPYHGHSLEHCLHSAGWVQRDLRLALDTAKATTKPEAPAVSVDAIARALFERRQHRHPSGNIPQWGHQPDHIKQSFREDANSTLAVRLDEAAIRKDEREKCAKICKDYAQWAESKIDSETSIFGTVSNTADDLAEMILSHASAIRKMEG